MTMLGERDKHIQEALVVRIDPTGNDKLAANLDPKDQKLFQYYKEIAKKSKMHDFDEVVLIIAVTPWEYFGANDNGDAMFSKNFYKIRENGTLPKTVKSFETKAMPSRNHQYQDPSKSIGTILSAVYHEKYKRCEVLVRYDWKKATKECLTIRRGKSLVTSMGYRIYSPELPPESGEFCSLCGKHARRTSDRCSHLASLVGHVVDGVPVFMMNGLGFFVDLSRVAVPGDFNSRSVWRVPNEAVDGE